MKTPLLVLIATTICLSGRAEFFGKKEEATKNNAVATNMSGRSSGVSLSVQGALVTVSGDYGGASLLGVQFQVDKTAPIRLGLESGIMFGSGTGLPILVSVHWYLADRAAKTRPYIGGSIGPVIGVGDGGAFDMGAIRSVSLALLIRPGLLFKVADALDLTTEMTIGGLTGLFYMSPAVGLVVHL